MPIEVEIDGHGVLEFPDDTPEQVIQSTVRQVTGGGAPEDNSPAGRWLRESGNDTPEFRAIAAKFENQPDAETQLSMAGGLAGPVGAGIGGGVGSLLDGKSLGKAAQSAALNFAVPKAVDAAIDYLRPVVSRALRGGAVRAMKGAIKPDRGYLEKMAGSKRGGIEKMETDIAETALDEGINPVRRKGLDALQGKLDDIDAKRTAKIAAATAEPIAGQARSADAAAQKTLRKVSRGTAPQGDIANVSTFIDEMRSSPQLSEVTQQGVSFVDDVSPVLGPSGERLGRLRAVPGKEVRGLKDLTPQELADAIKADNDRLRGLFGDKSKNAEVQARLSVQRANTDSLDRAAGTKPLSRRMKRLIDLRNVGNIATRRASSNNPVSLTDIISLSAGRPAVFAGSVGMKAPILAELGLKMSRAGKSVMTPSEEAEAVRRLLIALGVSESQ